MDTDQEKLIERFMRVFNDRDPDAIAQLMTEDGVLEASFGPETCGQRVEGREAIRRFYVDMFTRLPDAHWRETSRYAGTDFAVVESVHTATGPDGLRIETMICDVLAIRGGLIAAKRSYRKVAAG